MSRGQPRTKHPPIVDARHANHRLCLMNEMIQSSYRIIHVKLIKIALGDDVLGTVNDAKLLAVRRQRHANHECPFGVQAQDRTAAALLILRRLLWQILNQPGIDKLPDVARQASTGQSGPGTDLVTREGFVSREKSHDLPKILTADIGH